MKKLFLIIIGFIVMSHLIFAQTISATKDTVCPLSPTTLNATGIGASNYLWTPTTGLNASTGSSVIATPISTTTYSIIDSTKH